MRLVRRNAVQTTLFVSGFLVDAIVHIYVIVALISRFWDIGGETLVAERNLQMTLPTEKELSRRRRGDFGSFSELSNDVSSRGPSARDML